VGVVEPVIGLAPPIHLIVTEPSGEAIVIEFAKGGVQIFDAPLGVITNAPTYDCMRSVSPLIANEAAGFTQPPQVAMSLTGSGNVPAAGVLDPHNMRAFSGRRNPWPSPSIRIWVAQRWKCAHRRRA
jgi:hypothetical protein